MVDAPQPGFSPDLATSALGGLCRAVGAFSPRASSQAPRQYLDHEHLPEARPADAPTTAACVCVYVSCVCVCRVYCVRVCACGGVGGPIRVVPHGWLCRQPGTRCLGPGPGAPPTGPTGQGPPSLQGSCLLGIRLGPVAVAVAVAGGWCQVIRWPGGRSPAHDLNPPCNPQPQPERQPLA